MPSSYSIGSHYESFIRGLIDSGRYTSASEVLRDGLRLLEEREEQREAKLTVLRQAIREGMESGDGIAADEFFAGLERKYRVAGDR